MKGILGMTCAAIIVLVQLAAVAAWPSEAELHLAPVDSAPFNDERRA